MLTPDLNISVAKLAGLITASTAALPFTGAGISTECGIPDFRSPGGFWSRNRPIPFDEFIASAEARAESWRRRFALGDQLRDAKPGRGHHALASLHRAGKAPAVITQNIDNLHQESGFADSDVVELHGNTTYAACLACTRRSEIDWIREQFDASGGRPPDCPACGGLLKTATISFGQSMPQDAMLRAEELTRRCDLFLSIGSSLVVWPAASFPLMAKRNGARLVILNREPTEFDDIADLVIRHDIGATLESFIAP